MGLFTDFMEHLASNWDQAKESGNQGFSRATSQIYNNNILPRESARQAEQIRQTVAQVPKRESKQLPKNETKQVTNNANQNTSKNSDQTKSKSTTSTKSSKKSK